MKHLKTFIFILFLCQKILSNNNQSFPKTIDSTTINLLKLNYLDCLILKTKNTDFNTYTKSVEDYVNLAIELHEYEKAISQTIAAFNRLSINTPEKANNLLFKVEKYKNKTSNTYLIGEIYTKKAQINYNKNNFKEAIKNYTYAIETYSNNKKDSLCKADAILLRGQTYVNLGQFLKSIEDYELALKYYRNLNDLKYVYFSKTAIAKIYSKIELHKKAIKEFSSIISEKIGKKHTVGLTSDYYNLSINYKKIGNDNKYREYLFKALRLKESRKDDDGFLPYYESEVAKYYIEKDSLNKAKKILDLVINKQYKMLKNSYSLNNYNLINSIYLFKTKNYNEALILAKKTLLSFKAKGDLSSVEELNKLIHEIYLAKKDHKNALYYFKSYIDTKDSISRINKISVVNYFETLLEVVQKRKTISDQEKSIAILAKKNQTKKEFIVIGSFIIFFSFLIFNFYRNRIHLEKAKKLQENYSCKLLLSQEDERKRISKDLHDGLGQSLLLIKNRIASNNDKKTEELINNSIEEIRRISKSLHPFQLENIGISNAFNKLLYQLDENSDTYIFGNIEDIDNLLSPEKELNIYRIVQECLSNVIKHAKAISAKVDFILLKDHINITIIDNGIGFNFDEKYNNPKSLGLKTIKERVKFLNGTLQINSIKNQGTTINILFPIK